MDHYFLTLINGGGALCTIQRLKATCDEALSNLALNFNLRRYILGCILERRVRVLVMCALFYVGAYSFLPHKELRFIFPALPLFNAAAAAGAYTRSDFSST